MNRFWLPLVFLFAVLAASSCGGSDDSSDTTQSSTSVPATSTTEPPPETTTSTAVIDDRQSVVIDTDMSVEGAMAILYLLQQPDVRVDAITVAGTGLVPCRVGVDQALGLVALANGGDVPVACGSSQPLGGENRFPAPYRSFASSLGGVLLPLGGDASELSAPQLLASVIANSPEPVAIYADGPLTNIASMFDATPDLADNIAGITIMGGAVDVAGNTFDNPDAEFNIWIDPVAADKVLRAGVPVTLVPLDATNAVPLTVLHAEALEQYQATPIAETSFKLVRASDLGEGFVYMWDQLNAVVLVDESVVTLEERSISVVTEGGPEVVGTTIEDPNGTPVRVAVDADRAAFEKVFFSTLLGENFEPVDLSPDVTVSFDGADWTHNFPAEWPLGTIVVGLDNQSDQDAVVVFGWLIGDATLADLDAWDSIEQPPFLDVAGFMSASPNSSALAVIELTEPGMNIAIGLTVEPGFGEQASDLRRHPGRVALTISAAGEVMMIPRPSDKSSSPTLCSTRTDYPRGPGGL